MKPIITLFFSFLILNFSFAQTILFEDNFDSYTINQGLAYQSTVWETWTGGSGGGADDALVSDEHALSPSNSMKIVHDKDMVYKFGNVNTGNYSVEFNAFFHEQGYFNLQHAKGTNWAVDIYLTNTNEIEYLEEDGIANAIVVGTYQNDQWINFRFDIDIDSDIIKFYVDGVLLHTSVFSNSLDFVPSSNLDVMNFYGLEGFNGVTESYYYVDDFKVTSLPSTASLGDNEIPQISIFPNPAKDIVTISSAVDVKQIIIYDISGQVVYTSDVSGITHQISLVNFIAGIYTIQVVTEKSIKKERLIVV